MIKNAFLLVALGFVNLTLTSDISLAADPQTDDAAETTLASVPSTNNIKVGDTLEAVQSILGNPKGYIGADNGLTYFYERYTVWFESGKVTHFRVLSDQEITARKNREEHAHSLRQQAVAVKQRPKGERRQVGANQPQIQAQQQQIAYQRSLQRQQAADQRVLANFAASTLLNNSSKPSSISQRLPNPLIHESFMSQTPRPTSLSANRIGNFTYFSDGTMANRIGNYTYFSDGTTASRVGNYTYFSDGTTANRIGNFTYFSDGTTANRIGDYTYFSDGSTGTRIGNTFYLNR